MTIEDDYSYRCGYAKALLREAKGQLKRTPEAREISRFIDEFFVREAEIAARNHGHEMPELGTNSGRQRTGGNIQTTDKDE